MKRKIDTGRERERKRGKRGKKKEERETGKKVREKRGKEREDVFFTRLAILDYPFSSNWSRHLTSYPLN